MVRCMGALGGWGAWAVQLLYGWQGGSWLGLRVTVDRVQSWVGPWTYEIGFRTFMNGSVQV